MQSEIAQQGDFFTRAEGTGLLARMLLNIKVGLVVRLGVLDAETLRLPLEPLLE